MPTSVIARTRTGRSWRSTARTPRSAMSASGSRSLRPLETRPALLRAAVSGAAAPLLSVRALTIAVPGPSGGEVPAVDGVSFDIAAGEIVALVGESGCGKTLTSLALVDLVPPPVHMASGDVLSLIH